MPLDVQLIGVQQVQDEERKSQRDSGDEMEIPEEAADVAEQIQG